MKIEITSNHVITRNGTSNRTGKPYTIYEQEAYLHQEGKPYPTPMKLMLDTNDHGNPMPYNSGQYKLSHDSFYVGRFGSLECRPRLIAIAANSQQQAPASEKKAG